MRIGYFGGSFDPPHQGHLAVARAARDRFALNRVLLAPTARQPLKPHGPTASFEDRLRMTELLCAGEPGLEASAIDGPQPDGAPNYTADTLRRLRSSLAYPSLELFAILGADAFLGLPQWREPDQLLQLADWIVVSRPGFPLTRIDQTHLTPAQRARVHPLEGLAEPATATAIRAHLLAGTTPPDLTPDRILGYIHAHHLYQGSS